MFCTEKGMQMVCKMKIWLLLAIIVCADCSRTHPPRATWEYKTVRLKTDVRELQADDEKSAKPSGLHWSDMPAEVSDPITTLPAFGAEGWELVAAIPEIETEHGKDGVNVRQHGALLIFKRPSLK